MLDELRRVLRRATSRDLAVLLDEDLRQAIDDPLRRFGRVVVIDHLIAVELRLLLRATALLPSSPVSALPTSPTLMLRAAR